MQKEPSRVFAFGVATVLLALASPTLAQTPESDPAATRASVLDAAREALEAESTPPKRSSTERGLYWYDNQYVLAKLSAGWKGFHLASGNFPAGAGFVVGVGFDQALASRDDDPELPNRVDVTARAAYSTRGYTRLSGGLDVRNLGGAPVDVGVHGQYYEFPQEDFFGFGRDSLEADRTNYLLDNVEGGASVRWRPAKRWEVGAGASYLSPRIGHGTDSRYPSTGDLFDPTTIPGLTAQPDFLRADVSGGGPLAGHGAAGCRHHAEVHHPGCPRRHVHDQAGPGVQSGVAVFG
jgi:hypothetical protein